MLKSLKRLVRLLRLGAPDVLIRKELRILWRRLTGRFHKAIPAV